MSTPNPIKNVALIGATGNIGSLLLPALSTHFNLTIITRPTSTGSFPAGIPLIRTPYTLASLTAAFTGQDAVVSAIGAADFAGQKIMIDAAVAAGVKRFLPSEWSANGVVEELRELVPPFREKGGVLEYLQEKERKGELGGLAWTGVAVGALLDWGLNAGFIGFDLKARKAKIWDDGSTRYSTITVADLGKVVVEVLKHPEETNNRYVFAYSVTTSQKEILAELQKATTTDGEKGWEVEHVKTAEDVNAGQEMLAQGNMMGVYKLVQAGFWGNLEGMGQDFEQSPWKDDVVNPVLGIEGRSVKDVVREVVAAQS